MTWEIRQGDALERLREMPDESVQCCVTSPPYWGLRDYGVDGQLGLEETPEQFVASMVEVFAEVRRVLRGDGTLWLNIGDSYWSAKGTPGGEQAWRDGRNADEKNAARRFGKRPQDGPPPAGAGIKPKDLVGIPWMLAFAFRADGWYLRRDIIWAKPNPMPESVTDRPTSSHEYLFLLTKSPRYFYDAEAIREDGTSFGRQQSLRTDKVERAAESIGREWQGPPEDRYDIPGRNKRSVWTIATRPYAEAHFATFPPKLIEPCILAGAPSKACGECGAPWTRVVEKPDFSEQPKRGGERWDFRNGDRTSAGQAWQNWRDANPDKQLGFRPTCDHDDDSGRPTVLDPFCGAATTGLVATQQGRDFIGIELNPEYVALGEDRIRRWEANPAGHLDGDAPPLEGQMSMEEVAA